MTNPVQTQQRQERIAELRTLPPQTCQEVMDRYGLQKAAADKLRWEVATDSVYEFNRLMSLWRVA